jgi:hypothetical protein
MVKITEELASAHAPRSFGQPCRKTLCLCHSELTYIHFLPLALAFFETSQCVGSPKAAECEFVLLQKKTELAVIPLPWGPRTFFAPPPPKKMLLTNLRFTRVKLFALLVLVYSGYKNIFYIFLILTQYLVYILRFRILVSKIRTRDAWFCSSSAGAHACMALGNRATGELGKN